MTDLSQPLSIHSFHVNIGIGDCSIHLLVDENQTKPLIYRTSLIDGGKDFEQVLKQIQETIDWIEKHYQFAPNQNFEDKNDNATLRFDSVVITHWDLDHYGGVCELLEKGILKDLSAREDLKEFIKDSTTTDDKIESLDEDVNGYQCKYFKYSQSELPVIFDPKDPNVTNIDTLKTTLYVPYMAGERDGENSGVHNVGGNKASFKDAGPNGPRIFSNGRTAYVDGPNNTNTAGLMVRWSYKDANGKDQKKQFWLFDQCKLAALFNHYIGADLFGNKGLTDWTTIQKPVNWTSIESPAQLVKCCGLLQSQGPRMFIVAGDQKVIGDIELGGHKGLANHMVKLATPFHNREPIKIIDEHLFGKEVDGGVRITGVRKGSEPLNSASIVVIILSSSTATPAAITPADEPTSFELWHYLGGDALWDVEDAVSRWLTNSSQADDWKIAARSAFLKLSHHGAYKSTPASLLKSLMPKYVISPSGEDKTFGHPRPELLYFIHAMNEKLASPNKMQLLLYTWPIWWCDHVYNDLTFSMSALLQPPDTVMKSAKPCPTVRYLNDMLSYYENSTYNLLQKFWSYPAKKIQKVGETKKPGANSRHIFHAWQALSNSGLTTTTITDVDKNINTDGGGVLFIQTKVSYKATPDGIEANYAFYLKNGSSSYSGLPITKAKKAPLINVKIANIKSASLLKVPKPETSGDGTGTGTGTGAGDGTDTVPGPPGMKLKRPLSSVAASLDNAPIPMRIPRLDSISTQEIKTAGTELASLEAGGTIVFPIDDDSEGGWLGNIVSADSWAGSVDYSDDPNYNPSNDHNAYDPSDPVGPDWVYSRSASGRPFRTYKPRVSKTVTRMALPFHPSARIAEVKDSAPVVPMYICGADYPVTTPGMDGTYYQILVGKGVLNDFITQLQDGCLKLDTQWLPPEPPKAGAGNASGTTSPPLQPQFITSNLSMDDTWMNVLFYSGLGIQGMTFTGLNDGQFAQVGQISASLSFLGLDLVFSSAKSQFVGLPTSNQPSATPALDTAFAQDYGLFSLGLDTISGSTMPSLGAILNETTIPWLDAVGDAASIIGLDSLSSLTPTLLNTANSRSSIAFCFDSCCTTWLRLTFQLDLTGVKNTLKTAFPFLSNGPVDSNGIPASSDFVVNGAYLILLRTAIQSAGESIVSDEISLELDLTLGGSVKSSTTFDVTAYAVFDYVTTQFSLSFDTKIDINTVTKSLARMAGLADSENTHTQFHPDSLIANANTKDITFAPLQASIILNNPTTGSTFGIQQVAARFALQVYGTTLSCAVKFTNSTNFSLAATLWTTNPPDPSEYAVVPFIKKYDSTLVVLPSNWQGAPSAQFDFAQIIGDTPVPPDSMSLQTISGSLSFNVTKTAAETVMQFEGHISSKPLSINDNCPKIVLGDLALDCYYSSSQGYSIALINTTYLLPRTFPINQAIALGVSVEYQKRANGSSGWIVGGTAADITFASLFSLFDADANHAVMDFMEPISVPYVYVEWDYTTGSAALSAGGSIVVGPFELDFSYNYGTAPTKGFGNTSSHWSLTAALGDSTEGAQSLSALILALSPDPNIANILNDIPFVANIQIPAASVNNGDDPPIQFCITKAANGPTVMWLMLSITTGDATISFTYVQLQAPRSPVAPGTNNQTAAKQGPVGYKSAFRVMLDRLQPLPNVPVIGFIDQPFDSIDYVHVSDTTITTSAGFTTSELNLINSTMSPSHQIPYRITNSSLQSSSPNAGGTTDPPVLLPGHHFIMISNGNVLLDHIFGGPAISPMVNPASVSKSQAIVPIRGPKAAIKDANPVAAQSTALSSDSGTTMAPLSMHVGPIFSVQSIGLQSKNGYLYIMISATIALGPIQLSLEGFGVGIALSALKLNELKHLQNFSFILSGMSVDFHQPPVMIAGVFIELKNQGVQAYMGGLTVSILPYTLLAVGEYCDWGDNPPDLSLKDLKSVFVFARLDGPLLSLEFAEISGVEVGFGYNYILTAPAPANVSQFPLVHGVGAVQQNPMTTLQQFGNYNQPCPDSLWFAIGFKVDAFEILTVDAAALVNFSSSGFSISIIGIASASMPPNMSDRREMFVYVELGIISTLDILKGNLTIGAQLTPNSFVLYPDCHLTGGFALYYWFSPSPHAGDWVFSIGGYHPAFKPPDYYPVVPRLGISWALSDCLSIRGEGFFAITPKVCMGGGRLIAVFNAGPIYAQFEAWASFLMTFKPFFFIADIGVSVIVGFRCDIGLIHIDIHTHIEADLHLQGPKFGGVVHVNLWIHHFSVYFGDQDDVPAPLDWNGFVQTVQQQRTGSDTANDSSSLIVVAIEEGSANEKLVSATQKTGDGWFVRGGSFKFRVECKIPLQDMKLSNGVSSWNASKQLVPTGTIPTNGIYARLMGPPAEQAMSSTLNVTIGYPARPSADENPFQVTAIIRNMPNAMWDKYNSSEDPNQNGSAGNNIDSLLSPDANTAATTRPMLVGFHVAAPEPSLPALNIPEFNAIDVMSEGVFQDGSSSTPNTSRPLLAASPNDQRPYLPPTPDEQTIGRPEVKSAAPTCWSDVISAWSKDNTNDGTHHVLDRPRALCDAWASICGWGANAPPAATTPDGTTTPPASGTSTLTTSDTTLATPYNPLDPQKPSMILGPDASGKPTGNDLMNFGNYYLSCPAVAG